MQSLMRHLLAGTAFAALASPASAELTAEDVWSDWTSYAQNFGYSITGQTNATGSGLTVTGVSISLANPDVPGGAVVTMDQIVMTENGDGTVKIDLPAVMPMEIAVPSEAGSTDRISMDYRQTGMEIIASGTPDALNYAYDAEEITLTSTGFEVDGQVLPADANQIEVTLETLSGTSVAATDSLRRYEQDVSVSSIRYATKASDPTSGAVSDLTGQWQNVVFDGNSTLPLRQIEDEDIDGMLAAGMSGGGIFKYDANATTIAVASSEGSLDAAITSGSGAIGVALAQDGVTYDINQSDTQVEAAMSQVPLPLNFEIAETALSIALPVRRSDTPDDFALGFELAGFSMPELLWGMFDPGARLPRDPATVALELAGKAQLLFDVLDPTAATEIGPMEAPVELSAVDINRLEIDIAGARLSGTGAFEFENPEGVAPKPTGALDLSLVGGNGLLDNLVATGLLPEEQAMGARMMMGLLAVPGDAPDTLNSKLEINEEGHVLANGQRIQ